MQYVEVGRIRPSRLNPRLELTKAGLDELSDSMRQVGVVEPIIVRPVGDAFEIVVGERRYRAAQQAGLDKVPVIVREYSDDEVMEINLIENVHREDLSAVEKGRLCRQMLESYADKYPSQRVLAEKLAVGPTAVKSWLSLVSMPTEVQRRIAPETEQRSVPMGKVDYDTVVRISRQIKNPDKLVEVIDYIAEQRIPRRIATQVTKRITQEPEKPVHEVFREVVEEAPVVLPFSKRHADSITGRRKTQTSRKSKDPRLVPGVTVRAQITHFADLEVEDTYRKRLGDFDEEDAKREGGYTLEEFKEVWKDLHGQWNPDEVVYVIRFRLSRSVE